MTINDLVDLLVRLEVTSTDELNTIVDADKCDTASGLAESLRKRSVLTDMQHNWIEEGKGDSLRLDRYLLQVRIGAGGMGEVYAALDTQMKRLVAVKILSPEKMTGSSAVLRFQREVEALARLSHPHVVSAFDAGEQNGCNFLVLEYVRGTDITSIVSKRGPFEVDTALRIIEQIAEGLSYAHQQGVIHRDIKPSNLIVSESGQAKILDLGLARFSATPNNEPDNDLTHSGSAMGTVDYMSPEQIVNSKGVDSRCDIYSLGCVLFYMLTGKPVFERSSGVNKMLAIRKDPPQTLTDVPEPVNELYLKMIAKKPGDRFQSAQEVIESIRRIFDASIPGDCPERGSSKFECNLYSQANLQS